MCIFNSFRVYNVIQTEYRLKSGLKILQIVDSLVVLMMKISILKKFWSESAIWGKGLK